MCRPDFLVIAQNLIALRRGLSAIFITGILWFAVINVQAQDPIFSQFYLSPLQLNPGLAGLTDGPRFSVNYRNQFPGFNNAYKTYALSYDQFFSSFNGGIGFWLLADDAGDGILKTIKGAGIFSYRQQLSDHLFIKMGAEVGLVQSTLNWNQLLFGDQIDDYTGSMSPGGIPYPTEETAPEKNTVLYPDLGAGLIMYGETFYGGLSVRHLNSPDPEFLQVNSNLSPGIPLKWTVHGGATWPLGGRPRRGDLGMAVSPAILLVKQGPFQQLNAGVTFDVELLSFGAHYRLASGKSEAIIGSIGLRTNDLRIGYSFDYTISGFPLSGGSHELALVYSLGDTSKESRYNDCLRLFR